MSVPLTVSKSFQGFAGNTIAESAPAFPAERFPRPLPVTHVMRIATGMAAVAEAAVQLPQDALANLASTGERSRAGARCAMISSPADR
jgi:hypothetical protein